MDEEREHYDRITAFKDRNGWHRVPTRITGNRAMHSYPIWAQEESCRCGRPAAHKVEETSDAGIFHPLTAYLCCEHFRSLVGDCSRYPYDEPKPREEG